MYLSKLYGAMTLINWSLFLFLIQSSTFKDSAFSDYYSFLIVSTFCSSLIQSWLYIENDRVQIIKKYDKSIKTSWGLTVHSFMGYLSDTVTLVSISILIYLHSSLMTVIIFGISTTLLLLVILMSSSNISKNSIALEKKLESKITSSEDEIKKRDDSQT